MVQMLSDLEYGRVVYHVRSSWDGELHRIWREREEVGPRRWRRQVVPLLAVGLMGECGLRVGEVAELYWRDVRPGIDGAVVVCVEGGHVKYGRSRRVPVCGWFADILVEMRERGWGGGVDLGAMLVCGVHGGTVGVSVRSLQRMIRRVGEEAGVGDLWPHKLRHTYATRLLAVSNTRVVQMALGHGSVRTTEVYTHVTSDDLSGAVSRLVGTLPLQSS